MKQFVSYPRHVGVGIYQALLDMGEGALRFMQEIAIVDGFEIVDRIGRQVR